MKTKEERIKSILARGEHSDHSHVITGDAKVTRKNNNVLIDIGSSGAILKHIIESTYIETGKELWTEEHKDINLSELPNQVRQGDVLLELLPGTRTYKYIQQIQFDPLTQRINSVID